MKYHKTNNLHCFSPPVMIATFAIELILAVYVLWRYTLNETSRIIVALLLLLAVFQLAEYNVCEGSFGIDSLTWSRLGFMAISFLPALGLHLAMRIAGSSARREIIAGYVIAAGFALFFGLTTVGITASQCYGNYVIFEQAPGSVLFYTLYYYGWMIAGTVYAVMHAAEIRRKKPRHAKALIALAIGYLTLLLPTTTVNLLDPVTLSGIPSIMCGFAVVLALILGLYIAPRTEKRRQR